MDGVLEVAGWSRGRDPSLVLTGSYGVSMLSYSVYSIFNSRYITSTAR